MSDLWARVIDRLRENGAEVVPGSDAAALDAWETTHGVRLSDDLRAYFRALNGTRDMEANYFRFWSLDEFEPAVGYVSADDRARYRDCYAFADYCIDCWGYVIELRDGRSGAVFSTQEDRADPARLADSFTQFFEKYLSNPDDVI